jgi:hypothetical protein
MMRGVKYAQPHEVIDHRLRSVACGLNGGRGQLSPSRMQMPDRAGHPLCPQSKDWLAR